MLSVVEEVIVWLTNFLLTGHGEAHWDCGKIWFSGCLDGQSHHGVSLDGVNMDGKTYVKLKRNSCFRPSCPTCWGDWANRQVDRACQRLRAFKLKGRKMEVIHVVVSVPHCDYGLSLKDMRKKVYRALKMVRCLGGMMIFHPKRKRCVVCFAPKPFKKSVCSKCGGRVFEWYFSPHFHVLGYGWLTDIRKQYIHSGYVVKNLGIRKTLEGTIFYQLSHCGVPEKMYSITWFGALNYAKLKVVYKVEEPECCPVCGGKLHRLLYIGDVREDIEKVAGLVLFDDVCNWVLYRREWDFG